jgi:hypothetical protein
MTLFSWLLLCFFLLVLSFALMFFRRRIALWLSAHPRASRVIAFILIGAMIILSVVPILIIAYHSIG